MTTFEDIVADRELRVSSARHEAHHAAQLVAAAGVTHLEPDPHFHSSSTRFGGGRLWGAELAGGVRVSLEISTLTLAVVGSATRHLALGGVTPTEAASWLRSMLSAAGLPDAALVFPEWEMPVGATLERGAFVADPSPLGVLATWFEAGATTLEQLVEVEPRASEVRCWPHHFDLATLITLEAHPTDPEQARTVGVGLSPGDGGISEPYLYVTPWPYPEEWSTPALPAGRWNTAGWYGAVLEAAEVTGQAAVDGFLAVAVRHSSLVAGR